MILPIHIFIALSSVVFNTYLWFRPSKAKLKGSYILIGLTLASGTYLVISTGSNILSSCETGLVYICVVSVMAAAARHKLAQAYVDEE